MKTDVCPGEKSRTRQRLATAKIVNNNWIRKERRTKKEKKEKKRKKRKELIDEISEKEHYLPKRGCQSWESSGELAVELTSGSCLSNPVRTLSNGG